ncbi:MAG: 23S rRNA (pseudouridine(1915)-N(3))-methyltransferase RlmH [Zetaproteobacteria bacterium]|nr:MAG: 23S rRNA (pseudouridine(1915)-N(3))-methyltransferase RlmH [Zetaproteobacteria bacterium]
MRQRLIVVGRGDPALAEYEQRFVARIRRFAPLELVELPAGRERRVEQRRVRESARILRRLERAGISVLFDERGAAVESPGWAAFLDGLAGNAAVDYIIGGADGVEPELRRRVDHCWSLSRLTLPHQLVRVVVLEQLYRAHSIRAGQPYHRS